MKKHQTYIKQPMKTHSRKTNQQKNYNIYKPVRTINFALEVKKPMKTHKKINTKLLSTLLILLMITPALFTTLSTIPVYASTGQPKLASVNNIASPTTVNVASANVTVQAGTASVSAVDKDTTKGGYFAIVFGVKSTTGPSWYVTFSGSQFQLYISPDGFSYINKTTDIQFGPVFNVVDLTGTYKQVGTTGYYIGNATTTGYYIVAGPIPINISQDYKYIKIFDGQMTAVAVSIQTVIVTPGLSITPSKGGAGTPVTIQGGGFPKNTIININYTYVIPPITFKGVLITNVGKNVSTGPGYFSVGATMVDTKQDYTGSGAPTSYTSVTLTAVNASQPSQSFASTTFNEYPRYFVQIKSFDPYGNPVGTPVGPGGNSTLSINAYVSGTIIVSGKYFYANKPVSLYVDSTLLKTEYKVNATGFFNTTFTVPILAKKSYTITVLDGNNVPYYFKLNVLPTLLLSPTKGPVGTLVTATAYGFTANSAVYLYWKDIALNDTIEYMWLFNATTGADGTFNITVTFNVPHTYGGAHGVNVTLVYQGRTLTPSPTPSLSNVIANATFTVLPAFTITPSAFSNNGVSVSVIGTGLDPTVSYNFTIDHSWLYPKVQGNSTGDFKFTFVAAGFRPGLHVVELYKGAIGSGYYAPVANVTFFVTADGDVIAGQFASILAQLSGVSAQLSNMNAVLTQVAGDVAVIKTDSGYVRVKVDDLMALLSGVNATVSTVASDVSGVKSDVAVIKSNVGTIMTSVNNLAFLLNAVGARIVSIQNDTATLKTNVGTIMATLPALNASITAVGNNVVAIKTSVGTLQGTVTDVKNGVATISTDVGTIKADVSTIKGNVSALQSSVKAAQDAASAANSNAASASSTAQTTMWLVVLTFIISLVSLVFIFRRK